MLFGGSVSGVELSLHMQQFNCQPLLHRASDKKLTSSNALPNIYNLPPRIPYCTLRANGPVDICFPYVGSIVNVYEARHFARWKLWSGLVSQYEREQRNSTGCIVAAITGREKSDCSGEKKKMSE